MPYAETVISAQKKIASERDNCYYFKTSDLPLFDNWHFTGNAAFELGTRFAKQILIAYGLDGEYQSNYDSKYFTTKNFDTYYLKTEGQQKVDTAKLQALLSICEYKFEDYTDISFTNYSVALTKAKDALNAVSQDLVNEAEKALNDAIDQLIKVYNKEVLSNLVKDAKNVNAKNSANQVSLNHAIAQAESLISGDKIDYETGEKLANAILSAISDVEKENNGESSSTSNSAGCGGSLGLPFVCSLLVGIAVINIKKKDNKEKI
jgi:hypothetical protein